MVSLRKMSQSEFQEYYADALQLLADELSKAAALTPEQALVSARHSFTSLLPDNRPDAPGQFLYSIVDGDQNIGTAWFRIREERLPHDAYVLDLIIRPPYRRKGYGRQVMLALEQEISSLGVFRVSLSVFEHNSVARRLYEQMGYTPVSTVMAKNL